MKTLEQGVERIARYYARLKHDNLVAFPNADEMEMLSFIFEVEFDKVEQMVFDCFEENREEWWK